MNPRSQVLVGAVAFLLAGCYRPPESPQPTPPGASEAFDALLAAADEKWAFVFFDDFTLVRSDIHGMDDADSLDVRVATGDSGAEFLGRPSMSPDGRHLLARHRRFGSEAGDEPEERVLLVRLADWSSRAVPAAHEDFKLEWSYDMYWLSDREFLVPLNRYTKQKDGYSRESVRYLRKAIDDLEAEEVVRFPTDHPVRAWHPPSAALLFASEDEPTISWSVWAYDTRGTREATEIECEYFERKYLDKYRDPLCPLSVKVERVLGRAVEGWGRYWNANLGRYWILLDGRIVRCSDAAVDRCPAWDADTRLFSWSEGRDDYRTYCMDVEGHYRAWHAGRYCGKVPKKAPGVSRGP